MTPPSSAHGGPRQGSGKKRKIARRAKVGRPPALGELVSNTVQTKFIDSDSTAAELVKVNAGTFVSRDRCMEVLRAVRTTMAELYNKEPGDRSLWKKTTSILELVRYKCNCGQDIAHRALNAIKECTATAVSDFVLNEITTRNTTRGHLRKLSPQMLGQLDNCIQSELINPINPRDAGMTVDAVRELIRNTCANSDVSRNTVWKAMYSLGYDYCKLSRKVKLTSKRRKRIEDFIRSYDAALEQERKGDAVIVYMDESYVHAMHKATHGWDVKGDLEQQINNCMVQQQEDGPMREGEVSGGKGTRHVFLCGMTRDGIVKDPNAQSQTLRSDTYEAPIGNVYESTSGWIFQAKKKGIKDYHDNMDSHMFNTWVEKRCGCRPSCDCDHSLLF